ncbi:MAG: tRNA (N6-threonylcarbamoyladenosine(37)-N6)-methyltransferase TrmO [Anaerolineaceae bacterium]|jgi:tRNA-Thr(GGU) m(6)t(6)A37 methyltransferase TsaA
MAILLEPIGIIHSPFTDSKDTPIQPIRSTTAGWIEIFPQFTAGLQDIEAFSHLYLIYHLHQQQEVRLLVTPFLDDQEHGVFATRHPARPNHIGMSLVRLTGRSENRLEIYGVDVFDGTPLLDIKPFVTDFDLRENVRMGWYETRAKK